MWIELHSELKGAQLLKTISLYTNEDIVLCVGIWCNMIYTNGQLQIWLRATNNSNTIWESYESWKHWEIQFQKYYIISFLIYVILSLLDFKSYENLFELFYQSLSITFISKLVCIVKEFYLNALSPLLTQRL